MEPFDDAPRILVVETLKSLLARHPHLKDEALDVLAALASESESPASDDSGAEGSTPSDEEEDDQEENESSEEEEEDDDAEVVEVPAPVKPSLKRKAAPSHPFICTVCDDVFYEEDNGDSSCRHHTDYMERDYDDDCWADDDGPINTKEYRKAFPERFTWICCDALGNIPGCKLSRHRADPRLKNRRY